MHATTHHDVRLQHSGKIAELAPAVTIRFPADLVEPVVEPVADIGARPPPCLLCERGHVHFKYRPSFEHARRRWVDRRVRGRRGDGRKRRWVDAVFDFWLDVGDGRRRCGWRGGSAGGRNRPRSSRCGCTRRWWLGRWGLCGSTPFAGSVFCS